MKVDSKLLLEMIDEELDSLPTEARKEPHDHEGTMARSEVRNTIKNGLALYKMIGKDDELPGWVSSYISLANDYINSVTQFMSEEQASGDENYEEPDENEEDEETAEEV